MRIDEDSAQHVRAMRQTGPIGEFREVDDANFGIGSSNKQFKQLIASERNTDKNQPLALEMLKGSAMEVRDKIKAEHIEAQAALTDNDLANVIGLNGILASIDYAGDEERPHRVKDEFDLEKPAKKIIQVVTKAMAIANRAYA